jgi:hypothetical protein
MPRQPIAFRKTSRSLSTVREEGEAPGSYRYYLHNVGRGTAINLWFADMEAGGSWRKRSLGAMSPGGRRLLINELQRPLCDSGGEFKHF